jgi:hypothetical protein
MEKSILDAVLISSQTPLRCKVVLCSIMSSHPEDLPPHLTSLVPSQWAVWRWFVLRGAGFPSGLVNRLTQPECASAADSVIQAEIEVEREFQAAIRALNEALDRLKSEGVQRHDEKFVAILNARRRLTAGKVPESSELNSDFAGMFEAINLTMMKAGHLGMEFDSAFSTCIEQQSMALRAFAEDARFCEAIIWQNRNAFENAIQPVARQQSGAARNQRQRHHEELIANYVQRYCVKNDTIGFFGPVAWGRIEAGGSLIELDAGESLLKNRHSYFECWAVDQIAISLSRMAGMAWWIPPRLAPDAYLKERVLYRAGGSSSDLTELELAVLSVSDGTRLPEEVFRSLQNDSRFQSIGRSDLHKLLTEQSESGNITWRFLVPVEVNSEVNLRRQLLRIGDAELCATALAQLDDLEMARSNVTSAAGDPVRLNDAMRKVEQSFESITSIPGLRNPGATYGGRTILYEDCQRDIALKITPDLLSPILPALSLLLQSLRWLMQSTAQEFHRLFRETYNELRVTSSTPEVRVMDWWLHTEPKLLNAPSLKKVDQLFRRKWAEILPVQADETTVRFKSDELIAKVAELFPEPGPGFYPVRYFCPDLMLAAADAGAIKRGELLYVLGEVHSGKNTLCHAALVEQHPSRQDLIAATQWDLSASCFKILNTHESATTTVRTSEGILRPADFLVATTSDASAPNDFDSHGIGSLVLQEQEGELYVIQGSDGRRFHILEAFSDLLFMFVMNKAAWIEPLLHAPRVLIDQLVIHRETWRFSKDDMAFAMEKDENQRFLGARRWMTKHGIPQRSFVKSVSEMKPFYLDLGSPILVEILCRAIRRMNAESGGREQLTFSEMLPSVEQLWLKDSTGDSYTSELRFAMVDLEARSWSHTESRTERRQSRNDGSDAASKSML